MTQHVRILGGLYIAYGALLAFIGLVVAGVVAGSGLISGQREAIFVTGSVAVFIGGLLILIATPAVLTGIGLLKRQPWARIVTFILAALNIFSFPFGTALAIYSFWVLTRPEVEAVFNAPHTAGVVVQAG